jgi:hypothetical protein
MSGGLIAGKNKKQGNNKLYAYGHDSYQGDHSICADKRK